MEDKLFSLDEVVEYLKIPKSTIYKLSQKGKIPSVKIGKQLRFRKSSLDSWLENKEGSLASTAPSAVIEGAVPLSLKEKEVLLIDDDPLVLKSVAKFLQVQGYRVESAQSAEEALQKVEEKEFSLIITDIRMPGLNGIEAVKRIRQINQQHNRPAAPEIVITGYMDTAAEQEARSLNINDYLYKPFVISELIKIIKSKI
jgi:excisionase family DNA binding protein